MIDFLRGVLSEKSPFHAVIEVQGVGYPKELGVGRLGQADRAEDVDAREGRTK